MTANDSFIGAGLRDSPYAELRAEVERLTRERDEARAALRKYGQHIIEECACFKQFLRDSENDYLFVGGKCSCGLDAALHD